MAALYLSQQNALHIQIKITTAILAFLTVTWIGLAILFIYQFRKPLVGDLSRLGNMGSRRWSKEMGDEECSTELDEISANWKDQS